MVNWKTGDTITAEKLNAMQIVTVEAVVNYAEGGSGYVVESCSHTYTQVKEMLENKIPVNVLVTLMDGDAPKDHFILTYSDSNDYGDYTYIIFRGISGTATPSVYNINALAMDIETNAYFYQEAYAFTPAT